MFVEVVGGSKSQKRHTQGMVEFCAKKLMPRLYNLDIFVHLCKPTGALGYCLELENNRTFELEIDRTLPLRQLLETVAHEMVHVKQYALGELNDEMTHWRGLKIDSDSIPYDEQEWEIEAETVGLMLYQDFQMEHND